MTADGRRVTTEWLALREPADAAARSRELVRALGRRAPASGRAVIHDLGGGTGAMGRWLAPRLPGPQHWVVHDRDAELLARAAGDGPARAADGAGVTVEPRRTDVARLRPADLAGATLITASALLDMLTGEELAALLTVCAGAGAPILLTLSVTGTVTVAPSDPLDRRVEAAFNAHQRRRTERGPLLGPDAVAFAAEHLRGLGARVTVRASAWRLGAGEAELAAAWWRGWVAAACEQEPRLTAEIERYARERLAWARAGRLAVTVGHADLLALPAADDQSL